MSQSYDTNIFLQMQIYKGLKYCQYSEAAIRRFSLKQVL